MIDFKDRANRLPSGIIVASIIVIMLALMFVLIDPAPTVAGVAAAHIRSQQQMNTEIADATKQSDATRAAMSPLVWRGGVDTVAASILAQLTTAARQDKVTISAFRPQRTRDLGGITELPIAVQVAGAYHGVHALMSSLDAPGTKIVLSSAQITASQAASNSINGMLGLSAYIASDPTVLPDAAPKTEVRHG